MTTAILTLLTLIEAMLGSVSNPAIDVIDKIIAALVGIVPTLASEVPNAVTAVKNIITALSTSGNATAAQMASLQALDAQVDADFEAAATAAGSPLPPAA